MWGANAEATLRWNTTSLVVKPIEIFLLKVMRKAKAELDRSADSELLRDVDLFNKQEAQHFKTHAAFNKVIRDWCADVEPIRAGIRRPISIALSKRCHCDGCWAIATPSKPLAACRLSTGSMATTPARPARSIR